MVVSPGDDIQTGAGFLWFGLASGLTWALFKTINVDQR